jgi:uncharacterized membrane protein
MMELKKSQNRELNEAGKEKILGYIGDFSNALFAFAITLLIIDISVPAETTADDMGSTLLSMWPYYLAFFISFFVIAQFWLVFIRFLKEIISYNTTFIFLMLVYLFFIVIIPFSTSLLSQHLIGLTAMIYAALLACAGYALVILRIYAYHRHRLIDEKTTPETIRQSIRGGMTMPLWFTATVAVAYFSPVAAQICWISFMVIYQIVWRLIKKKVRVQSS